LVQATFFFDGDPAPLPKMGQSPHPKNWLVYCGQTAGWIKMPLGIEIGLGPGHIMPAGHPAPHEQYIRATDDIRRH